MNERNAAPKIAVVGGGSYQWGPKIIEDVALNEDLSGSTLTLHDLDPEALADLYLLGERMVSLSGADINLEKTTVLEEALAGADFVVLCISTGGLNAMALDLEIPARYGVVQTVGDTVGPGGVFRALRNIPVVVGIARAMEEHCPDAVMLNLTNPMTTLTRAITKATSVRCVGLCHEIFSTLAMLSEMFDVPEEEIDVRVAGVNHFIWVTAVSARGKNVTQEAFRRVAEGEARERALEKSPSDDPFVNTWGMRTELCRTHGYLPAAGDRHVCEFVPGYLESDEERGRLDLRITTMETRREKLAAAREQARRMAAGEDPIPLERSREEISDIIAAMTTGRTSVNIMNLPNKGQLCGVPDGAVVETFGAVGGLGASGVASGELPPEVAALVHPHVWNAEVIVDAALTGDRDLAYRAFANDPLVGHRPGAREMFDEMFEAQSEYLSHFEEPSGLTTGPR